MKIERVDDQPEWVIKVLVHNVDDFDHIHYTYCIGLSPKIYGEERDRIEEWADSQEGVSVHLQAVFFKTKAEAIEFKLWW